MKIASILAFAGVLSASAAAHAGTDCYSLPSNAEQGDCLAGKLESAEKRLALAEARMVAEAKADDAKGYGVGVGPHHFEETARKSIWAWRAYMEAECGRVADEGRGGTFVVTEAAACPLSLVERRIADIRSDTGRVAVVGDSIAVGMTAPIAEALAKAGDRVDGYAVSGSGLANRRLADWPAKAKEIAASLPTAVVVQIGTNDGQGMGKGLPFGTDAWKAEYRRRADAFLAPFVEVGTEIRCLETLPADRPDLKGKVPLISGIVRDACLAAGASFVPVGEVPPKDRAGDRVHLTVSGYDRLGWLAARAVHTGTP